MIALTTAVAIAVTCSVIFMVSAVVITIIWVKIRQERRSLALIKERQGPYAHGLATFPAETLTELSREEGSALRQYGQLPYGRPTEWGLLASRESLVQSAGDKSPVQLLKKTRSFSLKHSLSSKSKRNSKNLIRLGSLTTLAEASEASHNQVSASKENLVVSAVEGVMELPTETTPRQTPEREEEPSSTENTIRPISGAWPLLQPRERSSALFPVFEDHHEGFGPAGSRIRGSSITSQTAGMAPDQPVPPPPCAYPPNRFRLSKNDSLRFSSVSLETADSSILDDSRRASAIEGSLTSPALPPCPTFAPYSANDVGRGYDRRSLAANAAPYIFPPNSPARRGQRVDSERGSPRRSLTACSPTRSSERISPPPRRSESLSARQSRDTTPKPYLDLDHIPPLNITSRNTALLPHFSQMQRHSMHGSPRDNDPFYNGVGAGAPQNLTYNPRSSGRRASSFFSPDAPSQNPSSQSKPPLTSALKGSGHRKGHRRQNCVRISIHPPITFAGPAFSPMVEEPEEVEEVDVRRSEISDLSTSNVSRNSSVSAMSTANRNSIQGSSPDRPISRIIEPLDTSRTDSYGSPTKKRRQTQSESAPITITVTEKTLPGIFTSLPTTTDKDSLSHTPSPERNPPVWTVGDYQVSPATLENSPAPGSPRRSAVMGPRSQPGKPARNSYQSLIPSEDSKPASPQSSRAPRTNSTKESTRKPSQTLRRVKSEARDQTPPRSPSQADRKRASNYTTSTSSYGTAQQKTPGTSVKAIVPIWEDQAKKNAQSTPRRSTVSLVHDPSDQQGGDKSDASPKRGQGTRMARMSSYRNSKHGYTTPARKAVGLGIGATTPGSLYDGDGFLRERERE
ncbi:hypothetical protein BJY04DRAFT_185683 [Aspergillus karnatakaensis]|uniref:uncharacterized protein n=1 Tax=Aspergillus karnatakaensis TaxID=1810916 RepID=UPI003CCCF643